MQQDKQLANQIAAAVQTLGGTVYYVGGCVRDELMGLESKDMDIEVHGISPRQLYGILSALGTPIEMGKSFGVFGMKGYSLDISMPRKETLWGHKHTDFSVEVAPHIGTFAAARRRDFTIGALMKEVLSGNIIDHFGGLQDLQKGILRHVDERSFPEDPLRVLRAAQFAARFSFTVAEQTVALCSKMDLSTLSPQRVMEEMKKALLYAPTPSRFFEILKQMHQLNDWFAEVQALQGVAQNPVYHAEGDVWNHTMMVLDCAAAYRSQAEHPFPFMLSALCHDFGKTVATFEKDGVLHSYGHEQQGLPLVDAFLHRLTNEKELCAYVRNMTALHMQPCSLASKNSSLKSTNKLLDRSLCPKDLILLSLADYEGRITTCPCDHGPFLWLRLEHYKKTMAAPHVNGEDLIQAGLTPGEYFGKILSFAHKLRLAGIPKDTALKQCISYARKEFL